MPGNIKGITIEIDANAKGFQKSLAEINKQSKKTQNQLKDINKLLKLDPKNVSLLEQKQKTLNTAITQTKDKLKLAKDELQRLKDSGDKSQAVTDKMESLERQIVEDENKLKSLNSELKDFGSVGKQQSKAVAQQMQETGKKIQEVGSKIKGVGDSLTKNVTGPIVALGGASLAAFNEVDSGYDIVIKKTGAAGEAAQAMYDIVDNLATSIPTDFETAGTAVGEVNTRFGLTGEALQDLSERFIQFADLNDTDVSSSIDAVQAAMEAFGVETESAGDVLDILNKAGQDTGSSMDELANALLTNGPALQEMGFGLNDAVGFLANLEKSGVDTSSVLTGLKTAMKKATKEGKPLNEAVAEMQKEMEGAATDTEAAQKASELFGTKAGPAIAKAVREGRLSFDDLANGVQDWQDSVSNTFTETLDPIDQWKLTMNELKLTGAEVGATLGEILQPVLKQIGDTVSDLREKWNSLTPEQQKMIEQIAIIVATVGPVIAIIGGIITKIGALISAIGVVSGVLGVAASTIGIVIVAITAIIAAIVLLITHWDQVKAKVKEVWEKVTEYVTNLKENIVQKWEEIKSNIKQKIDAIKADLQQKWNQIKTDAVNKVVGMKNDIVNKMVELKSKITEKLNDIKSKFTEKFEEIKGKVKGVVEDIKGFFTNLKLKIPKPELPKLPHFSLEWGEKTVLGQTVRYPSGLKVDWYAKAMNNPYLLTTPTVMQTPYGAVGGGESGHELMYGHQSLMRDIGTAVKANNENLTDAMYVAFTAALRDANLTVNIGRREFGRIVREMT